jgi:hypothetical protein
VVILRGGYDGLVDHLLSLRLSGRAEQLPAEVLVPITWHAFHGEWNYTIHPTAP